MSELSQASCEVCRIGAPKVSDAEANELLQQIPDWSLLKVDGINQLQRKYKFKNFVTDGICQSTGRYCRRGRASPWHVSGMGQSDGYVVVAQHQRPA